MDTATYLDLADRLGPHDADRRAGLLALADVDALTELGRQILGATSEVRVLNGPETGLLVMQVREPVAARRFHLGEVLATRALVEVRGHRGWSTRLDGDRAATLAAALADAEAAGDGPLAADVHELCHRTEVHSARERATERAEIAPTAVRIEALD